MMQLSHNSLTSTHCHTWKPGLQNRHFEGTFRIQAKEYMDNINLKKAEVDIQNFCQKSKEHVLKDVSSTTGKCRTQQMLWERRSKKPFMTLPYKTVISFTDL